MAMFAPIPLPGIDNPQFKDVMDYFEQIQQRKQKQPLVEAQTKEAQANALKTKLIANLLNIAFGEGGEQQPGSPGGGLPQATPGQGYVLTPEEKARLAQMQPGDSLTVGQNQGGMSQQGAQPTSPGGAREKAKQMLYQLGLLKESPQDQESREARTAYQKEIGASDVKQMDKWNDTITASHEITPVLENIQEISANPAFQEMYKNPEYLGYDIKMLKRFGSPEQQALLTSLGTNAKSIFSSLGQEFKGAFREFEYRLFKNATPDEINDTLPQIVSKTNTLLALQQLVTKRLSLAQNIVRSSGGKISPSSALEIADRQINGKQVRKQIEDQFKKSEIEQKEARNKANPEEKKTVKSPPGTTSMFKNGNEYHIPNDKVEAAKKAGYTNG